jgi:uncharacterized protein YcbK (DUF882 family)
VASCCLEICAIFSINKGVGMITWKEMLCTYKESDIDPAHLPNMKDLHEKVQKLRAAYSKPMTLTNCYRSMTHHLAIYKKKGITDKKLIPMKSKHLSGKACDLADPDGKLLLWCKANVKILEEIGLWCEDGTVGWTHVQSESPNSGKRFFMP